MHLIDQQLNLMIRGHLNDAWKIAKDLEKTDPDNFRAKFNRGWLLIQEGKFQEGYQNLEYGRALKIYGDHQQTISKSIWNQSDLTDKIIILVLEGDYGDKILYARFATEIWRRGGICILCSESNMHPVFLKIPGVSKCITKDELQSTYCDFWIPSLSCSWLFGHTVDNVPNEPYISAKQESTSLWKTILKTDKPQKVGILWSDGIEVDQNRLFPPKKLVDICENDDVQFYCLQKNNNSVQLPEHIQDLQHLLISWEDVVACVHNLDLVITTNTHIAHISSAMGKPTWVIVPTVPQPVWAHGDEHSPWYQKTTRVFRQKKYGEWDDVFDDIKSKLKNI